MEQIIFERPDTDSRCEGWILFENGDVTFLMIPSAVDGKTPLIVVARDVDGDGIFHQAENYWLNDEEDADLRYLRDLMEGASLY